MAEFLICHGYSIEDGEDVENNGDEASVKRV